MKMTKHMRESVKQAKRLGLRVLSVKRHGKKSKHPKMTVTDGTKTIKVTIPVSASDWRWQRNQKTFLKHAFNIAA